MEAKGALAIRLKKAGLSEKAATVYAFLLENGGSYPSAIAEKTGLNRSTVYKILIDLSVKGVINEIEKGKKLYYQIEKPSKLLRFAEHQVTAASDAYESVQNLYPELEGYYALLPHKPRVLYFEGKDEVVSIYDDHIAEKKPYEMLGFANTTSVLEFLEKDYFKKYRKRKQEIGITTRGIFPADATSKKYVSSVYDDVSEKTKPSLRFIPQEEFPFQGEITIYGESKVSIINLGTKRLTVSSSKMFRSTR